MRVGPAPCLPCVRRPDPAPVCRAGMGRRAPGGTGRTGQERAYPVDQDHPVRPIPLPTARAMGRIGQERPRGPARSTRGRDRRRQRGMTEKRKRFRIMYQTSRISSVWAAKPIQPLYQSTPGIEAIASAKKTCHTNT